MSLSDRNVCVYNDVTKKTQRSKFISIKIILYVKNDDKSLELDYLL